jgi:acetylornithine/succinyldiaminopimelate/putrescine aminotransferase
MIKTKNRIIQPGFDVESCRILSEERKNIEDYSACSEIPVLWDKAKNYSVYDNLGNKWIDLTSGIFVANAGHSNPKIKKAIRECLKKDLLYSFCYNNEIRVKFIKKLLSISPSCFNKAIISNSGSEATDTAYKLIKVWGRQFSPHKNRIISFKGAYHGRCLSSCFLSRSKEYSEWAGFENDVTFLDFPERDEDFPRESIGENVAAFVIETYQGWSASFLPIQYMKQLYEYAKEKDVLIVFDEIQSGFYRTGKLYGYMNYGEYLEPDIITLGKGISSSLPMSAVLSRKEIVDMDKGMDYSGTHPGDPICCYAALANLEFLHESVFQRKLKNKIKVFSKIKEIEKYNCVQKVNVFGMVAGIIFSSKEIADRVVYGCINNGVFPVYTYKNSIKLGPPLTISNSAIKEAFGVLETEIKKHE